MPRSRTSFEPGHQSRGGRPKGAKDRVPRKLRSSVAEAWRRITEANPELLRQALERGLASTSPRDALGYLHLGAQLQREIGHSPQAATAVQVVFVGSPGSSVRPLDPAALRAAAELEARNSAGQLGPAD